MQAAEPADEILRVSPMILSNSKMEDLSVEVCGENGAYYKVIFKLSSIFKPPTPTKRCLRSNDHRKMTVFN